MAATRSPSWSPLISANEVGIPGAVLSKRTMKLPAVLTPYSVAPCSARGAPIASRAIARVAHGRRTGDDMEPPFRRRIGRRADTGVIRENAPDGRPRDGVAAAEDSMHSWIALLRLLPLSLLPLSQLPT